MNKSRFHLALTALKLRWGKDPRKIAAKAEKKKREQQEVKTQQKIRQMYKKYKYTLVEAVEEGNAHVSITFPLLTVEDRWFLTSRKKQVLEALAERLVKDKHNKGWKYQIEENRGEYTPQFFVEYYIMFHYDPDNLLDEEVYND